MKRRRELDRGWSRGAFRPVCNESMRLARTNYARRGRLLLQCGDCYWAECCIHFPSDLLSFASGETKKGLRSRTLLEPCSFSRCTLGFRQAGEPRLEVVNHHDSAAADLPRLQISPRYFRIDGAAANPTNTGRLGNRNGENFGHLLVHCSARASLRVLMDNLRTGPSRIHWWNKRKIQRPAPNDLSHLLCSLR